MYGLDRDAARMLDRIMVALVCLALLGLWQLLDLALWVWEHVHIEL